MPSTTVPPQPRVRPLDLAAWAAALFLASTLFGHTIAVRQSLLALAVVLALAETVMRYRRGEPRLSLRPPLLLLFLAFGAWAIASLGWTERPDLTLKELRNEVLYPLIAFWACYVAAQGRRAIAVVLVVLGVGAAVMSVSATYWAWAIPEGLHFRLHGGAGALSSALVTLMPCALMIGWLAWRGVLPRSVRYAALVIVALLAVAAYSTLSRTVWLAFAVQLGIIVMGLAWREHRTRRIEARRLLLAAVGVAVIGAVGVTMVAHIQQERFALPTEYDAGKAVLQADPRLRIWPQVIRKIEERPLLGIGYGRGMGAEVVQQASDDPRNWHSHNLFLETTLQTGIPGLVLLVLLLGATAKLGARGASSGDDVTAACALALIAVLAGMLVRNMTDVLWVRQSSLLYWGVVGALLGCCAARSASARWVQRASCGTTADPVPAKQSA
jgi:O-antigen ligase